MQGDGAIRDRGAPARRLPPRFVRGATDLRFPARSVRRATDLRFPARFVRRAPARRFPTRFVPSAWGEGPRHDRSLSAPNRTRPSSPTVHEVMGFQW